MTVVYMPKLGAEIESWSPSPWRDVVCFLFAGWFYFEVALQEVKVRAHACGRLDGALMRRITMERLLGGVWLSMPGHDGPRS